MDKVRIQLIFTETTKDGSQFTDALYFDKDEYENLSESDLKKLKADRLKAYEDNLKAHKDRPPETPQQELDKLIEQEATLEAELLKVKSRKTEAQEKVK